MNVREICEHLFMSQPKLLELQRMNVIPPTTPKGFDPDACRSAYITYLRQQVVSLNGVKGALNAKNASDSAAKDRLANARAEEAELDVAVKRDELVATDHVRMIIKSMIIVAKSKLEVIPSKIAPRMRGARSDGIAEKVLRAEIQEVLETMAATKFNPQNE